ncbi:ABC transporter ATP-binding protein [Poriferisphaera sp. WC338]|uniref:ABC transporter ATP-binding protein n=1 Tax=Poriferisphaera sp. WC338 TaxID=3425129 RepID=UPI003D816244
MTQPVIQVENLAKRYNRGQSPSLQHNFVDMLASKLAFWKKSDSIHHTPTSKPFWALKDINFTVDRGEVVGIIGHNGAGKSTILKILSRITDPTEGRATIHGRVASLLEVGTGFHPELTGRENIFLNGTLLGMTRAEVRDKFDEIVAFADIRDALDTPVKRYSSGMRVRLAFAVAAHLDPEILVIDEVLAVGDMNFQKKCLGKMKEAATKQARTVLFVSHNMSAVQSLCNRCIWLDNGQVKMIGDTTTVIDQYLSAQTSDDKTHTSNLPRITESHGKQVRINHIQPQTTHDTGFYLGEPLTFDITLDASITANNLRFGVCIKDMTGGPILSSITPTNLTVNKQARTATLTVDQSNLAPGSYIVSLAVGYGSMFESRSELDIIQDGPAFTVLPITQDGQTLFNWHREYGHIVNTHATTTTSSNTHKVAA